MSCLTHHSVRISILLAILATAFSPVQAGPSTTSVPALTDSIPKTVNGQQEKSSIKKTPPPPPANRPVAKEMFGGIREKMPLFPGCNDQSTTRHKKECSDSLLLKFVYDNLQYPYTAWHNSVEGTAVIGFYIEKDGTVTEPEILRDPGAGTGAEALRIINLMVEQNLHWTPGEQMGKPVRVRFNMPVKFKRTEDTVPFKKLRRSPP